jgi:hypothetical protein
MARAICIRCGEERSRALAACTRCGFLPETAHDRARSMVASSQVLGGAQLDAVRAAIEQDREPDLPLPRVLEYMELFDGQAESDPPVRIPPRGCGWLLLCAVLLALLAVVLTA